MEIVADLFALDNTIVGGSRASGRVEIRPLGGLSSLEMGGLAERVDAGVGPARAVSHNFFFGDFARGIVDGTLNRGQAGLKLPAVEGRAIVGDREFDVAHAQQRLSHAEARGRRLHCTELTFGLHPAKTFRNRNHERERR